MSKRPARACGACHEKKVRCDLVDNVPCSNCRIYDVECRPHERQRKRKRQHPPLNYPKAPVSLHTPGGDVNNLEYGQYSPSGALPPTVPVPCRIESLQTDAVTGAVSSTQIGYLANSPQSSDAAGEEETPASHGYLGRSEYLGSAPSKSHEVTDRRKPNDGGKLTEEEMAVLEVYRAFDLPPLPVQRTLIENFETYCAPWMPVVDKATLRDPSTASILLLQSIFLAGSRVAAASHISASSEIYYRRAKALFFSGYDSNPITRIAAACLLNWWNPFGPDEVSVDGSGFWLRVGISLAHQIGLHREPADGSSAAYKRQLWWTLVARDCQTSAAHGRPRGIDLADSDMPLPTASDFRGLPDGGFLFAAYVRISVILGDTTQGYLRHQLSPSRRAEIRNALYCWITELPDQLCLFNRQKGGRLNSYHLRTRSLHVPYFVILSILYRSTPPPEISVKIGTIASSFLSGIFEEFLVRDEFRFLPPIFKFYVFAAGMALIHARTYASNPRKVIGEQLDIVEASLSALASRWSSANANIKSLQNLRRKAPTQAQKPAIGPLPSSHEAYPLFQCLGPDLCRMWDLISPSSKITVGDDLEPTGQGAEARVSALGPTSAEPLDAQVQLSDPLVPAGSFDGLRTLEQPGTIPAIDETGTFWDWSLVGSSGSWLLEEFPVNVFGKEV